MPNTMKAFKAKNKLQQLQEIGVATRHLHQMLMVKSVVVWLAGVLVVWLAMIPLVTEWLGPAMAQMIGWSPNRAQPAWLGLIGALAFAAVAMLPIYLYWHIKAVHRPEKEMALERLISRYRPLDQAAHDEVLEAIRYSGLDSKHLLRHIKDWIKREQAAVKASAGPQTNHKLLNQLNDHKA